MYYTENIYTLFTNDNIVTFIQRTTVKYMQVNDYVWSHRLTIEVFLS